MSEFSVFIVIFLFQLPIESSVEFLPISRMAAFSSGSSASARSRAALKPTTSS
jgi:hypothetical protein